MPDLPGIACCILAKGKAAREVPGFDGGVNWIGRLDDATTLGAIGDLNDTDGKSNSPKRLPSLNKFTACDKISLTFLGSK
jgi:hypothetical protein